MRCLSTLHRLSLILALVSSKRSFEQLVWTPGPLSSSTPATTATTASSATIFTPLTSSAPTDSPFREFSKSALAGQEPRTPYYALPGFQQSPNGPDDVKVSPWPLPFNKLIPLVGKTALEVVTELEYGTVETDDSEYCEGMIHHIQHHKVELVCYLRLQFHRHLYLRPYT